MTDEENNAYYKCLSVGGAYGINHLSKVSNLLLEGT